MSVTRRPMVVATPVATCTKRAPPQPVEVRPRLVETAGPVQMVAAEVPAADWRLPARISFKRPTVNSC